MYLFKFISIYYTGITEKKFEINESRFHIFDVGGQKSERKKWFQCFDDVRAVVFVISLSCYNEVMYEDEHKNCMVDSLELFKKTINNSIFDESPIILFLNKRDLFEIKIKSLPITSCPVFENTELQNENDYKESVEIIKKEFRKQCENEDRNIYMHITCAMDDKNIQNVFDDVTRMILSDIQSNVQMI